jgi:hypothetical protein
MNRTFDWRRSEDPRNARYPLRDALPSTEFARKTWRLDIRLDQGNEGACVGFGTTHGIAAAPKTHRLTDQFAMDLYHQAQTLDEWTGENYEGSSVNGGMKAARAQGYVATYRWAQNVDDLLAAVSHLGPVVMGTVWHEGMWEPDGKGFLHPTGDVVGGHCWLVRGVDPGRERVLMTNSWGRSWGLNGGAYLSFTDLEILLAGDGEAAIPTEN